MNRNRPTEDLASALFHATSASKLLVHAIQQRVHADKIKDAFISADGKNAFLDTYCSGIRDSWNESRTKAETAEVWSLKAYCHIGRNIWTGFTPGYGNENHPSYLLYRTDKRNYPAQQSAASLPVHSLLSTFDQNCHVMQFRLSRKATEVSVEVNTPLFLDAVVPVLHRIGLPTHSPSMRSVKRAAVNKVNREIDLGGSAFYSETAVLAKLTRFMDQNVAFDAFDKSVMTNEELKKTLSEHINKKYFLKTSLECAEAVKEYAGFDLVTTAIIWPPLKAFSVIGMIYSSHPLCRNAIGFFASALPKLIPVCTTVAYSLRPWESDGDQILAEIQKNSPAAAISVSYVVAYWNNLWNNWTKLHSSGPKTSKNVVVVGFHELLTAIDKRDETYLSKAKTAVNHAISRLASEKRLRHRFCIEKAGKKQHSLCVEEI